VPLPIIEIVVAEEIFNYDAKYCSKSTRYRLDPNLPHEVRAKLDAAAIGAAESLGTAGLSRVDLLLDDCGDVWVLEVNTIPGLTDHSLAPGAAAAAGLNMASLVDWMVRAAVRRRHSADSETLEVPT
jgi:D-alanine-D-alanine ligase